VGVVFGLTRLLRLPGVNRWQMAIGLGQVGEFSFVVGTLGVSRGFVPPSLYTGLLLAMAVSIAATATLARVIGKVGRTSPEAEA
jgi:CPA2 family monovalent cation:H+ antiporter-2